MAVRCQWCGEGAHFEHTSECRRCHAARVALDLAVEGLPYLAAHRLTAAATSRLRGRQQSDFAAQNPDHYQEGWHKRHVALSEFLTAAKGAIKQVTDK